MLASSIQKRKNYTNYEKIVSSIRNCILLTREAKLTRCQYIAPDHTMKYVTVADIKEYFEKYGYSVSVTPKYKARTFNDNWSARFGGPREEYQGLCFTITW